MVLLSPSIGGLRKLLYICENFAHRNGMMYNVKKCEMMVFRFRGGPERVPPVYMYGSAIRVVKQFKYLGHILTESLSDDADMERERRALAVRCNMLARRFSKCSRDVKIVLFKAYCQSFYTCQLWTNYTRRAYSILRVQYNDALRILLRLPRYCSAKAMFADARVPDFFAVMRQRAAGCWDRVRSSSNELIAAINQDIYGNRFMIHWSCLHQSANKK
ncbi:uncharacterized protein LOC125489563 [Plutella xylostella]|nr:uncharacterized protein LOC125489563 [Plutella xylostella]